MLARILTLITFILLSTAQAKTLQVMAYNVENLFDTKHDEGKKDWTFLPKDFAGKKDACQKERNNYRRKECLSSDWTDQRLEMKLNQIKDVVTKDKSLPDFLGVVEVENSNVVALLAKKLGYEQFELSESPDERGIDVALLYKNDSTIKKVSRAEHVVAVDYPTRNILEVEFLLADKYPLTIFVNHWPSQANPSSWRVKAAEVLAKRIQEIMAKNPQMAVLALGDFNSIDEDNPHPIKTVLEKENLLLDVSRVYMEEKSIDEKVKKAKSPGTYYYAPKDQWNHLDRFLVNKNLLEGKALKLDLASFDIYAPSFMTRQMEKKYFVGGTQQVKMLTVPKRFDAEADSQEAMGFSDHFPLIVNLSLPEASSKKEASGSKAKKAKK